MRGGHIPTPVGQSQHPFVQQRQYEITIASYRKSKGRDSATVSWAVCLTSAHRLQWSSTSLTGVAISKERAHAQRELIATWELFRYGNIWGAFDEALRYLGIADRATGAPYVSKLTPEDAAKVHAIIERYVKPYGTVTTR